MTTVARAARTARALSPAVVTTLGIQICRYALILVIGVIGLSKFTPGEASAIAPLVLHSPFLAWTAILGQQTTSDAIGSVELLIAVLLLARPLSARAAAVGAFLAIGTFLTTSSFLLTTPHTFAFNGLAILSDTGAFLIKDLGLLGASIVVLGEALTAIESHGRRVAD